MKQLPYVSVDAENVTMHSILTTVNSTATPTWISGHVLCRFVNEQLKLSQLELSVRVQPESVRTINSGVAVFKLFTKYFDSQRPNGKKGVVSASYVHRVNANWYVAWHLPDLVTDLPKKKKKGSWEVV